MLTLILAAGTFTAFIAEEKINIKRKFGIFLYNIYPKLQS